MLHVPYVLIILAYFLREILQMQTKLANADKTGFISFMCEIISLYFSDFSDPQSICHSKKRFWRLFLVIFLVMVNVNLLWAVNVESEMLPMKLKGIATHQRVLKGEVREAFFSTCV